MHRKASLGPPRIALHSMEGGSQHLWRWGFGALFMGAPLCNCLGWGLNQQPSDEKHRDGHPNDEGGLNAVPHYQKLCSGDSRPGWSPPPSWTRCLPGQGSILIKWGAIEYADKCKTGRQARWRKWTQPQPCMSWPLTDGGNHLKCMAVFSILTQCTNAQNARLASSSRFSLLLPCDFVGFCPCKE